MATLSMKRLGLAAVVAALPLAAIAAAQAQGGFPPDPPMVVYGKAPGTSDGDGVVALVESGGKSTFCGVGAVVTSSSDYVVQVADDSQTTGCGASGRTIRLYFPPSGPPAGIGGNGGQFASPTFPWSSNIDQPTQQNVTLGSALQVRAYAPGVAAQVD